MSVADILGGYPPPLWTGLFAAYLGLCFGSFAGLAAYRIPAGIPVDRPPSFCPACKARIPPWRNLPLIGWLWRRGRSSCCDRPIPLRYPLCELATGALAVLCWHAFGITAAALGAFAVCLALVILSTIDIEHMELPDSLTQPLLWAGLLFSLAPKSPPAGLDGALPFASPSAAIAGAACGYAALAGLNFAWRLWRKVDGLGAGDPRLLCALGAWFGPAAVALILAVAMAAAGAVGLARMAVANARKDDLLPLGPFLAGGALLALFAREQALALWDEYVELLARPLL